MREHGLAARRKRRFRRTTDSRHGSRSPRTVLARNFDVRAPNQVWVTDITYVWTREGWLYLAVMLDLFSRRVVGWAMARPASASSRSRRSSDGAGAAATAPGLVHHSDRGCQYASDDYRRRCDAHGIVAA